MKNMIRFTPRRGVQLGAALVCAGFLNSSLLQAGDAKAIAPAEEEPFLNNWINMSLGGLITSGNKAQFQQQNPTAGPMFGGIDDMHIEKSIGKAQMVLDAHAIFPSSDYKVKLDISLPDVGYIRGGYTEFCTYSNGNGGYLPPNDNQNGLFFPGPEYALYRGLAWVELGLRVPNFPELTLRYEHAFRSGQEDSTSWGGTQSSSAQSWGPVAGVNNSSFYQNKPVNPQTGLVGKASNSSVRKIVPSFRNINEQRDTFTFDAKYLFGKPEQFCNTEVAVGMRYEFINNSDSLNFQNAPGGAPTVLGAGSTNYNLFNVPQVPTNYYVTQTDNQKAANYSGHASTVTRFGDKLWLTVGYGYSAVSSTISGGRVAGPGFGSPYSAYTNNLAYGGLSSGYIDMGGNAQVGQSVTTVNLLWMPIEGLSITPAARFENSNTIATSSRLTEMSQQVTALSVNKIGKATNVYFPVAPAGTVNSPTIVNSAVVLTEFNQALDIRYSGLRNWVFYAKGEWTESYEDRQDSTPNNSFNGKTQYYPAAGTQEAIVQAGNGGVVPSKTKAGAKNGYTAATMWVSPTSYNFNGSNANITQKYTVGANWYPLRQLNMAIQYYTQFQNISQTIFSDDPTKVNPTKFFVTPGTSNNYSSGWTVPGSQKSSATNQRLISQSWATNDVNFRVTWQPFYNLSIVTRYDFQQIKIDSQWGLSDSQLGMNSYPYGQSGFMTNSILSESVTWNPLDRLYVQGSFSYVVNTLSSPASSLTPAVTNSQNNYWTAAAGLGYALDNKTQVRLDGSYYCANNYTNNSQYGVPYGAGASEFDVTASVSRQITRNVGVSFTYFYNYYNDVLSGGNNSYTAQTVSASMQVKF